MPRTKKNQNKERKLQFTAPEKQQKKEVLREEKSQPGKHPDLPPKETTKEKLRVNSNNSNKICSDSSDSNVKIICDNGEENFLGEKYSTLLESSSALGSHFQFSTEKRWDDPKYSTLPPYFVLNLKSLAESLSEIPFFDRNQITISSIFQKCWTNESYTSAKRSKYLKDSITLCLQNEKLLANLKVLSLSETGRQAACSTTTSAMTDPSPSIDVSAKCTSLDDWLDSVLDD